MADGQPIVYCWRYEHQPVCKIGKTSLERFWNSRLRFALGLSPLNIEILGVCRCNNEAERDALEAHLLNERFDKVRADREELVYFNNKVRDWLQQDSVENDWTVEALKKIPNPYAEKNRTRERERQRRKRREKVLKDRAWNIWQEYSKKKSPLTVGSPAIAIEIVAEDLAEQGVERSLIKKWLDEFKRTTDIT